MVGAAGSLLGAAAATPLKTTISTSAEASTNACLQWRGLLKGHQNSLPKADGNHVPGRRMKLPCFGGAQEHPSQDVAAITEQPGRFHRAVARDDELDPGEIRRINSRRDMSRQLRSNAHRW